MATRRGLFQFKAYLPYQVEGAAEQLRRIATEMGLKVSGTIPLPRKIKKYTVIRSPHVHKRSRDQFEMRTHKRLVEVQSDAGSNNAMLHLVGHFREILPGTVGMRIRMEEIPAPLSATATAAGLKTDAIA